MRVQTVALLSLLSSLVSGGAIPGKSGFRTIWSDGFQGGSGSLPDGKNWQLITGVHTNNEVQDYTTSNRNVQISGGGSIQFVPIKTPQGWTSGRIESKYTFTPQPGKVTIVEGKIRFGDNPRDQKQGIWPAFWLLGDSIHQGTPWPRCGELDIMETINGNPTGYGTVHCGNNPGGPCNEPIGRPATVGLPDNGWHTWSIKIDRTNSGNFRNENIQWSLDGRVYSTLTGADIGEEGVWGTLAHSPLFIILNVAVGGDWPGAPNGNTKDSWGSMMEVEYVAVYSN
ncbi:concanavalin A-like lectin/glucanase domain-containing protein [Apodospora peruviana]|uniref:Concanavalin A-like lectin/glucanase domain-containing protein n=1 Tax=Apodospora peruviana TaxID=516989 RepID=A0AAE0M2T3_9PEZI|nr:concanavalin A-like lectin/glucanase domain-containing protein [Apodospora peruviana]